MTLPAKLEQALKTIARQEQLPMRTLVREAVQARVDAYREPSATGVGSAPAQSEQRSVDQPQNDAPRLAAGAYETVWNGRRDDPSLIGSRESRGPHPWSNPIVERGRLSPSRPRRDPQNSR
jgi:hypothetical protein